MNKHLYRIIFNQARGLLMVVAEIARSGRESGRRVRPGQKTALRSCRLSPLSCALLAVFGSVTVINSAQADIVADAQAAKGQQPNVMVSANGTPQVNIQTPSDAGVSRNSYSQFDVDQKGAILNNSHSNTSTSLGGMVQGNPWLAKGEARIIINEVNSRDPSQLNGHIEVAGQKAQVVIANPSGISCNGCGFINANRATLTTGQVQMNNGQLTGFDVDRGEIVIQGAGMNSLKQDYTDIIARSVKINAEIDAQDLNITTGRNHVDAGHQQIDKKSSDGSTRPQLALDVSQLGGMYANKIRLIGTEDGVGVHNAGSIGAQAGSLVVTADGHLENSGKISSKGDMALTSNAAINNSGEMLAEGNASLTTAGDLHNSGSITSRHHLQTQSATLNSEQGSVLAAGVQQDGKLGGNGNLTLNASGQLRAQGQNLASGDIIARSQGMNISHSQTGAQNMVLDAGQGDLLTGSGAQVEAQQQLTANSRQWLNNDGGKLSANQLIINVHDLSNQQGALEQLGGEALQLNPQGTLNNQGGSIASNGKDLSISAARINNQGGKIIHAAQGNLTLTADSLQGEKGQILSAGHLIANSGETLLDAGVMSAQQITLHANRLSNRDGKILQTGSDLMTLDVFDDINNQQGVLAAGGSIRVDAASLNNQLGQVSSQNNGSLDVHVNDVLNNQQGFIGAGGDATLTTSTFNNVNGTLACEGGLSLTGAQITNQQGLVQAGQNLTVDTRNQIFDNTTGTVSAGKTLTLLTGALLNQAGQVLSAGDLRLNTHGQNLNNAQGNIAAAGDAQLDIASLNNRGGQLQAAGHAVINAFNGLVDNTTGLIRSGSTVGVNAGQIINRDTKADNMGLEGQSVSLNSDLLDNAGGALRANDLLDITTGQSLNNTQGLLSSGDVLNVQGGNSLVFSNTGGTLIAGKNLQLMASSLSGDGSVLSQDGMTLTLQQAFFNQGEVIANGNMNLNVSQGLENSQLIKAGGVLNLHAASLINNQNGEISAGQNHLLIDSDLTNRGLLDGSLTHIQSATLNNIGSGRIYGDHIALQTGTLNNLAENGTAATIAARDRLDIGAQTLNNLDHGLIFSAGDVAVGGQLTGQWVATGQAAVLNNHSATLESTGGMALNISQINNVNDHLVTQDVVTEQSQHHEAVLKGATTRYDWADVDTSSKNKYGVHDAKMPDGSVNNNFYEYNYQRTITETQIKESDPGQIIAGGNLIINSNQLNNDDSRIMAGGTLGGEPGEVHNEATKGSKVTVDVGKQTRWYAKKSGGGLGGKKTSQGKDTSNYQPTPVVQTLDLQAMVYQGNTQIDGSGAVVGRRDTSTLSQQAGNAGAIDSNTAQRPITPPAGQIFEVVSSASAADTVIRISSPNTRLPDNSLFQLHPDFTSHYLVETDPRFTNQKQWLGSDYMQNAFTQSSDSVLKRLGDGYYEQRLIREQVVSLTGQRYLAGYDNDTDQYKALMDAGIAFGKNYTLTLGVALTPAQMALLTSDMVWLVKQDVTLPDGSVQSVLVPQVYARVKQGDLEGSGALLAGNNVALKTTHDLTNSGAILGREVTQISADTLTNSGFIGGNRVSLNARIDINNLGGTLQGGDSLVAIAGRDINSSSTLRGSDDNRYLDRPAGIYVQNEGGTLGLQALNNINLTATQVSNIGTDSQTQIIAGNDLNLNTLSTTHTENGDWDKNNYRHLTQQEDVGSQINGGGSVALSAGHDLNARAASVTAKDALTAVAGNDINLTSGDSAYHLTEHSKQTSKGMLSGKTVETHDEVQNQRALGSNISGDSVTMQAGHNLSVSGSSVAGTNNVSLAAGNDLSLTAADQSRQETHQYQEKKTGLSGTGGIGVSYGSNSLKTTDDGKSLTSAGSTVGSTQGNVTLNAGNTLTVKGSDVLAGKDINLTAKEVNILAADNQSVQTHTVEQKQSGLTLALSGAVGSAISTAVSSANDASTASSGRLAALDGMKSALGGVQAYQGYQLGQAEGQDAESLFGLNLSYGSQSSKSEQKQTSNQSQGSTLTAGNNLNIHATDTDINVQGSQLQAGKDIGLIANRDVNLWSGVNTSVLDGSNESHGSSVGVGLNFGQGKKGLTINVSGNKGKGSESGNGVTHTETTVNAGNNLNIVSGRDTTLTGAQVSGDKVTMDVGRNLTLASEQDSDNYDSKQQNISGGASVGFGSGSASVNLSQDKMHSTYDSVIEQTGVFAGKGGFDITVGEHTQLNGAVIGSTATADKNRLDTGTLGFSDIENKADYSVEHQSVGISTGGNIGGQFVGNMANTLLVGVNGNGSDSSTTKSAVSDGSIIIRDKDNQKQDVVDLSRDVEHANQTLSPIFDKEREQQRLQEAQKIGEIGAQVMDIGRTQGKIEATNAANEKMQNVTDADRAAAKTAWEKANPGKPITDKNINDQVYQTAYDKAFTDSGYGTGGKFQMAAQAATAAIQGLAGGDLAKAIAGGSAPYLANIIAKTTEDGPERLMAHAVVNAVLASVQGNSAIAGAAGAVTAEVMAGIAKDMYGKPVSELSEEQKQTISALSTLAAGLAGGLTGDSSADAVAGAQAGKTTVENNSLAGDKARESVKESKEATKALIREAMGENLASQLTNGLVNFVGDTGDLGMAGGDLVLDAAMALVSCATRDSYCDTATSDLAKKDAVAAGMLNAIMNGDAWEGIKATAVKAAQGDQRALENVAGILTGIVVPSSKIPFAGKSGAVTEQAAKSTGSLADYVKDNIALSEKARGSSNFAIHSAKSDQLQWGYAADEWSMTTLPAGSKVYGGIPGQSAYYTTEQTLLNANFGRESLFQSLQVSPHPEFGYRPQMGVYEVTNPITIPSGIVWKNPLLGPGGGTQFFIKDYNNNLKLIDKIDLGK
ncbi:hemagglutinin repeat-containing protein [Ewingella americana]|uniref:Filamentous hemagglutinin N-terminal domain-containing protein n=1 Tax=Ewingella americana TaxID=41202 RepID=A0A502GN83_9GAMM|nr:hemagglutinin repeat-containing protein [Ewingella americana]TPG63334.1 filamentous hemagglutinin N-terminal domain-containing protein [Ewingella americana]